MLFDQILGQELKFIYSTYVLNIQNPRRLSMVARRWFLTFGQIKIIYMVV